MKNIQVVDAARNCTYSLFAATDEEFALLFPGETDVAFPDEIAERLGETHAADTLSAIWSRPVDKKTAVGIAGTIFFELDFKKELYPTRQERGMNPRSFTEPQRRLGLHGKAHGPRSGR